MKLLITALIFTSIFASAHVEPGPHKGKAADGSVCEMTAGTTYFDKNTRHPLNERIEITVNGDTFVVGHPPVISIEQKSAFFDHDHFHGVLATAKGAKALVIKMAHTDTFEGPSEFSVITHEYRNDVRSVATCKLRE